MAEIDLTSSHAPWTQIPQMVDWDDLGDGSVFDRLHDQTQSKKELWRDPEEVQTAYGRSIAYSLGAVISFAETYGDRDLVVVVLGDHQPSTVVSGHGASRDVPVTVIAEPGVIDRISGWGWQDGMRPATGAPVWPMDAFRDRLLAAFSPGLQSRLSQAAPR